MSGLAWALFALGFAMATVLAGLARLLREMAGLRRIIASQLEQQTTERQHLSERLDRLEQLSQQQGWSARASRNHRIGAVLLRLKAWAEALRDRPPSKPLAERAEESAP